MRILAALAILASALLAAGCLQAPAPDPADPLPPLHDGAAVAYRIQGPDALGEPVDAVVGYRLHRIPLAYRADGLQVADAYAWSANASVVGPFAGTALLAGEHRFAAAWAEPLGFYPDGPRVVTLVEGRPTVYRLSWFPDPADPQPEMDAPLLAFEPLLHRHPPGATVPLGGLQLAFGGTEARPTVCQRRAGADTLCAEAETDGTPMPLRVHVRDLAGGRSWTMERVAFAQGDGAPIPLGAAAPPPHALPAERSPMQRFAYGQLSALVPPIGATGLHFGPALEEALRSKLALDPPAEALGLHETYLPRWQRDLGYRYIHANGSAYDATGTVAGTWRFEFLDGPADTVQFRRWVYEHAAAGRPVMEPATPDSAWVEPSVVPGTWPAEGAEVVPLEAVVRHYQGLLDVVPDLVGWDDTAAWSGDGPMLWRLAAHCHDGQPATFLLVDATTGALRRAYVDAKWDDPEALECGEGTYTL